MSTSTGDVQQVDYLPLCDLLFNIISLLSYFSDIVFDVLACYTLYVEGHHAWFMFAVVCICTSTVTCQVMSLRWHVRERRRLDGDREVIRSSPELRRQQRGRGRGRERRGRRPPFGGWDVVLIHVLQCGVVWRYFRLFMPVDLRRVKRAVRDLCILRLIHSGAAAGPMLLVHFYMGWTTTTTTTTMTTTTTTSTSTLSDRGSQLTRLHVVSTCLCMFSMCWALASFTKHIRHQNLHRLVLTWLGVIYQFFWRLGTVSSRVAALTLYATAYDFWVLLVIALHWLSMCLWLASNFPFRGEKLSRTRKCALTLLVTYVYVYCYLHVDLRETNARSKMITFYATIFFENTLLLGLWWHGQKAETPHWHRSAAVVLVWGGFVFGIVFMMLYYRYFHVTRLKHGLMPLDYNGWSASGQAQSCALCRLGTSANCLDHYDKCSPGEYAVAAAATAAAVAYQHQHQLQGSNGTTTTAQFSHQHRHSHHHHHHHLRSSALDDMAGATTLTTTTRIGSGQAYAAAVTPAVAYIQLPGVFNCRLNPAFKRKKKKPTTFIPVVHFQALGGSGGGGGGGGATVRTNGNVAGNGNANGKAAVPFWKKQPRQLPHQQKSSATATSVDHQVPPEAMTMLQKKAGLVSPVPVAAAASVVASAATAAAAAASSRVNIQQKLMEKRQKQLQELRVIEEEIKQGKFQRPHPSDLSEQGTLRQPIPRLKKQPIESSSEAAMAATANRMAPLLMRNSNQAAEILLSPRCLELDNKNGTMVYYDYWEEKWRFAPPMVRHTRQHEQQCEWRAAGGTARWNVVDDATNNRPFSHSDVDSQTSLPRSFTLPREFRYNQRRPLRTRRAVRSEHYFVTSTNSSDGDVDSGEEDVEQLPAPQVKNAVSNNRSHHHHHHHQQQQQQQQPPSLPPAPLRNMVAMAAAASSNLTDHHHNHYALSKSDHGRHETQL